MCLDMRSIDGKLFRHRARCRHFLKNMMTNTPLRPTVVAILSQEWKNASWDKVARQRYDRARPQSSNTAIKSFARAVEPGVWHKPQDCCEVARTNDSRGYEDWSYGAEVYCSDRAERGNDRGIPAPYAAALGRFAFMLCSPQSLT